MADYTKYDFNESKELSKNRLVLEVVRKYVNEHPNISYDNLKSIFPDNFAKGNLGIIKNEDEIIEWENDGRTETRERRFFSNSDEIIYLDNKKLYVSTQWGGERFDRFLKYAQNELGYKIEKSNDTLIYEELFEKNKNHAIKTKNIMLYGAPGVGKTHNYKRLITMVENGNDEKTIFDTISKNETTDNFDDSIFEEIKKDKRIEFITFHQSYSYEDFIEGFRPQDNGNIKLKNGVLKRIINQVYINYEDLPFDEIIELYKDFISTKVSIYNHFGKEIKGYPLSDNYINYNNPEDSKYYIDISNGINVIFTSTSSVHASSLKLSDIESIYTQYNYIKDNDFSLDTIAKLLFGRYIKDLNNDNNKIYYLYDVLSFVNSLKDFIKDKIIQQTKNFYIVIDEINRGNISKIFGELITLIEEDKRDSYEVTLPYSKERFKIPSNLYIIATMNSTDKSIATIDIALRRRFTFLKMKPNIDLVPKIAEELFKKLNEHISKTINEDYQLGHSYFMNIDTEKELEFVRKYKIKPLLEEYFYGDEDNYKEAIEILGLKEDE